MVWFLRARALTFLPVTEGTVAPPETPIDEVTQFQGWRTNRSVVLWQAPHITEVALDGGGRTDLSYLDGEVVSFQLASGLLTTAVVVEPGTVDRGPWPTWARLALGLLLAACAVPAFATVWYVRRRRRRHAVR